MNAARGALASISAMSHAKYLVDPAALTFSAEGTTITFATVVLSGYPKADAMKAGESAHEQLQGAGVMPEFATLLRAALSHLSR